MKYTMNNLGGSKCYYLDSKKSSSIDRKTSYKIDGSLHKHLNHFSFKHLP